MLLKSKKQKSKERSEIFRAISLLTQVAVLVIVCIAIGVILGVFLDNFFGTSPWLLMVFSLFGMGAAIKALFDLSKKF